MRSKAIDSDELHEPDAKRRYIVVSFWGAETERTFFASKADALTAAIAAAEAGADTHVARVLAERVASEHG